MGLLVTPGGLTSSGGFATTLTSTAATNVTLPTTGTLATTGSLAQFSATTSAQLAGVISNETGYTTGALAVFNTSPSFTTDIRTPKITTATAVNLVLDTNLGTTTGSITINTGANGNIALAPNGTGTVNLGDTTAAGTVTTGTITSNLTLNTNSGTSSGSVVINAGVNGNIYITPNGTGAVLLSGNTTVANASSNYFTLTGAASGVGPTIASAGAVDANVNFNVQTKGTGSLVVSSTTANTTSNITATGAATDIDLVLFSKGAGVVNANSLTINNSGVVTSGTWQGTIVAPTYGGTGINNGTKTITLGGNFTHTGAHTLGITTSAATSVTLPTSGTLYGTATSSITSAQLLASMSNETGTGVLVFNTSPSFTTDIRTPKITTATAVNLVLDTNLGTNTGSITINTGVNNNIALTPNGSGSVLMGDQTSAGTVTTGAITANLTLNTNNGTSSGSILITAGLNGNISLTPNGTGSVVVGNTSTSILKSPDATGTNIAAATLSLQGGANTGNSTAGGYIAFKTGTQGSTGAVLQTITERMRVEISGAATQLDLTTAMTTANVFNTGAATVNMFGASTTTKIGSSGTIQLGQSASVATTVQVGGAITGNILQISSAAAGTATLTTSNASNLVINTNSGTTSGSITINQGANANIAVTPNGTGVVNVGDTTASGILTTGAITANLTLNTNSGTSSGSIVITAGVNGNIDITPNGTGQVRIPVAAATMTMGPGTGAQNAITLNLGNASSTTQPTSATINFGNFSSGTPASIQTTSTGINYSSATLNNLQTFTNYTTTNTGTAMTLGGTDNRVDVVNGLSAGSFVSRGSAYFNGTVQGGLYSVFEFDELTLNDGSTGTFQLAYNQTPVTVLNPFSLLVTVNGLVQPAFILRYDMVWGSCFFGAYNGYTVQNNTGTLSTVAITGTAGQFSCRAAPSTLYVGQPVTITGTNGNGSYANAGTIQSYTTGTVYYITATNGTTTFTLSTLPGGLPIATAAGTPTNLTYTIPSISYIKFTSPLGPWSNAMIRNTGVNAAIPPQKRYPFRPAEIMLGT